MGYLPIYSKLIRCVSTVISNQKLVNLLNPNLLKFNNIIRQNHNKIFIKTKHRSIEQSLGNSMTMDSLIENYLTQWNRLISKPINTTQKNSFIIFQKRKLCIDESEVVEDFLLNEFLNTSENLFKWHLTM